MIRQMLGGSTDADEGRPGRGRSAFFAQSERCARVRADEARPGQRAGDRLLADLPRPRLRPQHAVTRLHLRRPRRITAPTLILTGDRDEFCSVEEAVTAYRMLPDGELAILPNTGHLITPAVIQATIEFFQRRATNPPGSPSIPTKTVP